MKEKITASTDQVEHGVALVSETGQALERIIGRIAEISDLVGTIAASAKQQSTGLQQVNTAVSEMDGVTQQNAAMVEEATAAARSLAEEAETLNQKIAKFRVRDGKGSSVPANPVHRLQARAASATRAEPAPRQEASVAPKRVAAGGGGAMLAEDDWSEF